MNRGFRKTRFEPQRCQTNVGAKVHNGARRVVAQCVHDISIPRKYFMHDEDIIRSKVKDGLQFAKTDGSAERVRARELPEISQFGAAKHGRQEAPGTKIGPQPYSRPSILERRANLAYD